MRRALSLTLMVWAGVISCLPAQDGKPARHVEKGGGFSFVPPPKWEMRDFRGAKYKLAFGPAANGFAPNINFVDEEFQGTLAEYVASNKKTLHQVFAKLKVLGEAEFKTKE